MQNMEDIPLEPERDYAMPSTDNNMMQLDAAPAAVGRRKQVRFKNIEDFSEKRIDAELVSAYTNRRRLPLFRSRDDHDIRFFSQNHFPYFLIIVLLSLTIILQTYRLSIIGRDMNKEITRNISGNLRASNQAGFDHSGRNMLGYTKKLSNSMPNTVNGLKAPTMGKRENLNLNSAGIRYGMYNSQDSPTANFNGMVPLRQQQQSMRSNTNKMSMIMPVGQQQTQLQNAQTSHVSSNILNGAATSFDSRNGNGNPNVHGQSMPGVVKSNAFYGSNNAAMPDAQSPMTQSSGMRYYSSANGAIDRNVNTGARSQYYPLSVSSSSYTTQQKDGTTVFIPQNKVQSSSSNP